MKLLGEALRDFVVHRLLVMIPTAVSITLVSSIVRISGLSRVDRRPVYRPRDPDHCVRLTAFAGARTRRRCDDLRRRVDVQGRGGLGGARRRAQGRLRSCPSAAVSGTRVRSSVVLLARKQGACARVVHSNRRRGTRVRGHCSRRSRTCLCRTNAVVRAASWERREVEPSRHYCSLGEMAEDASVLRH